jgi:hypothetical protein
MGCFPVFGSMLFFLAKLSALMVFLISFAGLMVDIFFDNP